MIDEKCQECGDIAVFRCCCIQIPLCDICALNHANHLLLCVSGKLNTIESTEDLVKELNMIDENFCSLKELENKLNSCKSNEELIELSEKLDMLKSINRQIDLVCPKMYFQQALQNTSYICEYNILFNTTKIIRKCCGLDNQVIIEYPNESAFLVFSGNNGNTKNKEFFKYSLSEATETKLEFANFPNLLDFSFSVYGKSMYIVGGLINSQDSHLLGNNKIYVFSFENNSINCFVELENELEFCVSTIFRGQLCIFCSYNNQISALKLSNLENPMKLEISSYLLNEIKCNHSDFLQNVSVCSNLDYILLFVHNTVYKINEKFRFKVLFDIQNFIFSHHIPCLVNPEGFYYIGLSSDTENNKVLSVLHIITADDGIKYEIRQLPT